MTAATTVVPGLAAVPLPEGAGLTHRGRLRDRNEDAILTDPAGYLWAVSDGMGGHGHGDLASDLVIDGLASIPDAAAEADPLGSLVRALGRANRSVRDRAAALGARTMGATVVALIVGRGVAHLAWAGDSRAYLMRDGALSQLTRDHTVVQDLIDRGALAPDAAARHPDAHVVTRAVGGAEELQVETARRSLCDGDWLLLCSDGLTVCLADSRIGQILAGAPTPEEACRALLTAALESGAPDNVSAVAVRMRVE